MTDFIISYDYTEEMIEEALIVATPFNFFIFHSFGKWLLPIFTVFITSLAIVVRTHFLISLSLFSLIYLLIIHLSKHQILQLQKDRARLTHGGKLPHITCTIKTSSQQLELASENGPFSTINLSAIKRMTVTPKLIIFLFESKLCVPIPKAYFIQGSAEELLAWLEQTFPSVKISYR